MLNPVQVGQNIREIRRRILRISQAVLGERLGCTQQNVARWERGETIPLPDELDQIATMGKKTVDWILAREVNSEETQGSASQEDRRIKNLIAKFREQANLSTKRHLATHIDFLLRGKVDE